ncbi:MAG: peptidyl-prolyl cis-trans isomerase [Bacteroides sp.]|nr:peptidyl-prolyl cis-trans isomerase [Bacteroides sp.]
MRSVSLLLFFFLLCLSCDGKHGDRDKSLLVEVDGNYLYKEELEAALPVSISKDDSLLFAENYIRNWAENVLLYDVAQANIPDTKELERLVENYRKTLIVHTYQQELIKQRISSEFSEHELSNFYNENKQLFVLDRPLIKGLFLKVPFDAPQLTDVREWYKTETQEALENLEKYSWQHAVTYDYFYDKWVLLSDVLGKMPFKEKSPDVYIKENRNIEVKDDEFYYFLNVIEYLGIGDEKPYDFARSSVLEMMTNLKKVDYIKSMKEDLYQQALKKNKIKYNY